MTVGPLLIRRERCAMTVTRSLFLKFFRFGTEMRLPAALPRPVQSFWNLPMRWALRALGLVRPKVMPKGANGPGAPFGWYQGRRRFPLAS